MIAPPVPSEHARGFDCLFGHKTTATPFGTHQAWSAGEAATMMHAARVNIAKQENKATGNLLMSAPPSLRDRARAAGIAFNSDEGTQKIISESCLNLKDL
jgi:hypothetical protein